MFFRNLTLFRFPPAHDLSDLESRLSEHPLRPVGGLEPSSRGFIPPLGQQTQALSHRIGNAIWISLGGEERILPAAVVDDLLQKKLAQLEEEHGRKPGGRARRQLRDDLVQELLPRAFVKPVRTDAMLDLEHGLCIVDTASRKSADTVIGQIRHALGSFPALPLNAQTAPRAVLTNWIAGDRLPDGLTIGDECELKDPTDGGAVVKCQHQELRGEEIAKHLEMGKQVTRLALRLNEHLDFVLGEDLTIRKLKFLDGAVAQLEASDPDDIRAELDARFALMAAELKHLFAILEPALDLSRA